jgi:hypothetical protein
MIPLYHASCGRPICLWAKATQSRYPVAQDCRPGAERTAPRGTGYPLGAEQIVIAGPQRRDASPSACLSPQPKTRLACELASDELHDDRIDNLWAMP